MHESWEKDAATMAAIASGDGRAFADVHARLYPGLMRLATSVLVDREQARDVVQDAFVALWKQAPRWEPRATLQTWLWKITIRSCLSVRQRLRRTFWAPAISAPPDAHEVIAAREARAMLRTLFRDMSHRERVIVTLHLDEHRSSHEIAALVGMNEGATRTALSRALARLRARATSMLPTSSPPGSEPPPQESSHVAPTS
jgi:RNA polymerase sigma-70 factor (ECF subfamily)